MTAETFVSQLWNFCSVLPPSPRLRWTWRDDGLSFLLRAATARQDGDYGSPQEIGLTVLSRRM